MYEHNRRPGCTVSDLVIGNEYSFRVFSENVCGLSDQAGVSKNTAAIAKTGEQIPPGAPMKPQPRAQPPKLRRRLPLASGGN